MQPMKKIYFVFAALAFSCSLIAQTVPNGSFEDWNNTQGFPEPDGWATFNIFSLFTGSDYGVTQEGPGAVGSSYIRLTCTADPDGFPTPAVAFTGNLNLLTQTGSTGFPVNNLPNFLAGQYRSEINGDDIAGILCYFTRWNAAASITDTLAIGSLEIGQSQTSWLNFDMPIVPMMAGTPDTCIVLMIAGAGNFAEVGNYLDVDDLHFTGGVSSVEEQVENTFAVYPNPMSTELLLDLTGLETINDVTLFDAQSRLVEQWQLGASQQTLDVAHLSPGLYILHVSNRNGRWTKSLTKN
jgi:hypothetical protein